MKSHRYRDYLATVSARFEASLQSVAALYGFDFGDEFELVLCEVLALALPQRYGVCRGFVVANGKQIAGDDIIIYDRDSFPTMQLRGGSYARKEYIPIEAVYAYIEAKHTLVLDGDGPASLSHAWEQVAAVKCLCAERAPVPHGQLGPYLSLTPPPAAPEGYPAIKNPPFGLIISRYVKANSGSSIVLGSAEIQAGLGEPSLKDHHCNSPDLVIAGRDNLVMPLEPGYVMEGPFYLPGRNKPEALTVDGLAFGMGLAATLYALSWIQLGVLPWKQVIFDGIQAHAEKEPAEGK